ncbi:MAG: 4Fe-4S dicluster domain-containing protein [Dehalococcoidales bacterium]|nr:4Fe-4S dicluster domain-containing protein [Dehalococcoidales bacterium]
MEINRRAFLTLSAASAVTAATFAAAKPIQANSNTSESKNTKSMGMLVDTTLCNGCRACFVACKQWNHNSASSIVDVEKSKTVTTTPLLDADTFTNIRATETAQQGSQPVWVYTKIQCMHCNDPGCVEACPVSAMQKTANGPVIYDQKRCFGCRYCMTACPFGIPTFQWGTPTPWIRKCTFCADRQKQGLQPACAGTCPTGALKFGVREDLILEAQKRIANNPGSYLNHIYGETEVGGTSWMYLAAVPFEKLGLKNVQTEAVTVNAKRAMSFVPPVLGGMALLMTGIYFLAKRKEKNKAKTVKK